ncbi:MAG: Rne/Rng family ribonuclease [Candidatus Eremiobacteraeota bacterium]|nr:Rne/Rng family ribonuclease [Candidatus Eremiobacteraeota bacterium]
MKTEILISCDDWENRVAVLEEGALAEIYFEREEKVIGSIYKGRVENVLPGMGACFVNIGLGRNAFLYVDDIMRDPINVGQTEFTDRRRGRTVNELLRVGDEILVQIIKEPRGLKGARVSTNISLPGRYMVLMPTGRYSGVSSRIEDETERDRLKQIMRDVRPEGMATIVRTAGRGVSKAELIADLGVQLRLWHNMLDTYNRATAPALVHKDLNLVFKAVRDFMTSDVHQVIIDSKEQFDEVRSTMSYLGPQYLTRIKLWEGPGNLFEVRGIDDELQKLIKPKIMLPSGGYLVLEHTEALTVIDVNTGKFTGGRNLEDTLVRTNIEGAAEIARQVRLRDIGGIIVVDFIDMSHERSQSQVIDTLTEALKRDRTRSTIQSFSNLGLLEFTRKRVGKDLAGQLRSECPYCGGMGDVMSSESLAIALLRQIRQRGIDGERAKSLRALVDPAVAAQLVGWYREEFEKLAKSYAFDLALVVEPQRHRESVALEPGPRARSSIAAGAELESELLAIRLPDPSSGVAVIENTLVEVRDGANGTGQRVRIKVTEVGSNLARAELSEPLKGGQARRRRGRGRVKGLPEGDAPIAPPAPLPVATVGGLRAGEPAASARPAPRRAVAETPFGFDEGQDDFPERAGRAAGSHTTARVAARPSAAKVAAGAPSRAPRPRPGRSRGGVTNPASPPPLVVGGDGDIDYEEGDAVVVQATSRADTVTRRSPAAASSSGPSSSGHTDYDVQDEVDPGAEPQRRRRRRGRGRAPEPHPSTEEDESFVTVDVPYRDEPARPPTTSARSQMRPREADMPRRSVSEQTQSRASSEGRPRTDANGEDVGESGFRPSRRPPAGSPRVYGPIRQLYGPPVRLGPPASNPLAKTPARSRPRSDEELEDLEVVVDAHEPAALDVPIRTQGPARPSGRRPAASNLPVSDPATTIDSGPSFKGFERPAQTAPEARSPKPPLQSTGVPARPPGRGRSAARSSEGAAPARARGPVRQVYPPPGTQQEEPAAQTGPKAAPMNAHRKPRGPMMRDPGSPPPPKGKVRQLYPPPPDDAAVPADPAPKRSNRPAPNGGSMFVSDGGERDERLQRARERAETRRQSPDVSDGETQED